MTYVVKIVGDAKGKPVPFAGRFVSVYEPTAFGGQGLLDVTDDAARAHQCDTELEAIEYSLLADQGGKTPLAENFTLEIVSL